MEYEAGEKHHIDYLMLREVSHAQSIHRLIPTH